MWSQDGGLPEGVEDCFVGFGAGPSVFTVSNCYHASAESDAIGVKAATSRGGDSPKVCRTCQHYSDRFLCQLLAPG